MFILASLYSVGQYKTLFFEEEIFHTIPCKRRGSHNFCTNAGVNKVLVSNILAE